jgi:hypothetical protein
VEFYDVVVERDGRVWRISAAALSDLDARVRRIEEAITVARQEIASLLGVEPDAAAVRISQIVVPQFGDISGDVHELLRLRAAANELESRAAARTAEFAKRLTSVDIPVRDIGSLLDLSPQRVSQLANTEEPAERIDVNVWMERTRWAAGLAALTDEEMTAVTGLSVNEAIALASGDAAVTDRAEQGGGGFPQPVSPVTGGRAWPAVETFNYVFAELPPLRDAVPRLFPRTPDPAPAVFAESRRISVPEIGDFAVHLWRPGDGGPSVAMVYADRHTPIARPDNAVAAILERLDRDVAAAALCDGEETSIRVWRHPDVPAGELSGQEQPTLMVADRHTRYRLHPVGEFGPPNVSRYWWTDLVNLLRVDLPWWPRPLMEIGAMLAWRPWTQIQIIVPQSPDKDPRNITGLASVGDRQDVRLALERQALLCLHRIASAVPSSSYEMSPGLVMSAVSAVDHRAAQPQLTVEEKSAILHHRTTEKAATAMFAASGPWDFMPVFTYGIELHPDQAGPLATRWISRLVDVAEDRRDEVGFRKLRDYLGDDTVRWLTDPSAPDSWVIQSADGRLAATVGTRTPNAIGRLTAAEIDHDAAFFEDSAGTAWPIPDTGYSYYATGYRGSGPQRLTETITQLLGDARADVHEPNGFDSRLGLYELFSTVKAPYPVPAELLEAARPVNCPT